MHLSMWGTIGLTTCRRSTYILLQKSPHCKMPGLVTLASKR